MGEDTRIRRRLGERGVRTLLLLAAAVLYLLVYLPSRREREALEREVEKTRIRVTREVWRLHRVREHAEALRAREPATVEDAIRGELRKGRAGDLMAPPLVVPGRRAAN